VNWVDRAYWPIVRNVWRAMFAVAIGIILPLSTIPSWLGWPGALRLGEIVYWVLAPFCIAAGIILAIGSQRRFRAIAPREPLILNERFASGHSERMLIPVGASRCLTVAVSEKAIYVYASVPIHMFSDVYDLMHRIPIENVTSCERRGQYVRLCWEPDHLKKGLRLRMRRGEEFVRLVNDRESTAQFSS